MARSSLSDTTPGPFPSPGPGPGEMELSQPADETWQRDGNGMTGRDKQLELTLNTNAIKTPLKGN